MRAHRRLLGAYARVRRLAHERTFHRLRIYGKRRFSPRTVPALSRLRAVFLRVFSAVRRISRHLSFHFARAHERRSGLRDLRQRARQSDRAGNVRTLSRLRKTRARRRGARKRNGRKVEETSAARRGFEMRARARILFSRFRLFGRYPPPSGASVRRVSREQRLSSARRRTRRRREKNARLPQQGGRLDGLGHRVAHRAVRAPGRRRGGRGYAQNVPRQAQRPDAGKRIRRAAL